MDKYISLIDALANGVNPVTGEELPEHSPYNSPEVIRALFHALETMKGPQIKKPKTKLKIEEKQTENISNGFPKNAGLPWTNEQRQELTDQFSSGKSISQLAEFHERTSGAITSELKKQGLIEE